MADRANSNMFCVIGDVNAGFGRYVRDLLLSNEIPHRAMYKYPQIPDDVATPNDNAHVLSSLCSGNYLLVVNNLQTNGRYFPSKKTFQKSNQWISELDVVVASCQLIENIENLDVHQTDCWPSDHAPISLTMTIPNTDLDSLVTRVRCLGGHAALEGQRARVVLANMPVSFADIDMHTFFQRMSHNALPDADAEVDVFVHNVSDTLYVCSRSCTGNRRNENYVEAGNVRDRWETILQEKGDSRVWRVIDWKGMFQDSGRDNTSPPDREFKEFYESNLCSDDSVYQPFGPPTDVNIPILYDPISYDEVSTQMKNMKVNRASDPDRIPPGVVRSFSAHWIVLITGLFNLIFRSASYPVSWANAKMFTIFNKGSRRKPKNYRGITIINSMAKLNVLIL